jgi:arylformamidase
MPRLLKTAFEFMRLRGASSLFDRGYTIQFELNGLRRPEQISSAGLRVEKDICYHAHPDKGCSQQSLDIYAPGHLAGDALLPVVVFMHGGGWRASDKQEPLGVHANICKALARRRVIALNVNYRLSPRVKHPTHVRDAACALHWVRENIQAYKGDPENVFVSGHSAGGHLASLITLDSKYLSEVGVPADFVKGVIGVSGVYNIEHFAGRNWMAEHLMARPAFGKDRARWADASSVNHARSGAPPFLLLNAEEDGRLEEEAEELAASLRMKGVRAEVSAIAGTNHFTILSLVGNGDDTLIDRIIGFVN